MIKNNPIIKSILVLYVFIYSCVALYEISFGVAITELLADLTKSIITIIATIGFGICLSILAISLRKNYLLGKIVNKKGNGRYGTTQGLLPAGIEIHKSKISLKNDLPDTLTTWIKTNEKLNAPAVELFINALSVLKHHSELPVEFGSNTSLYAHSVKTAQKLLDYSSQGVEFCSQLLITNKILSPNHMRHKYLEVLINGHLLPLIGVIHDIGKVISVVVDENGQSYHKFHYKKARLIVTKFNSFWSIKQVERDALLFALSNYVDLPSCPKVMFEKSLVPMDLYGELLVQLLICAHNEVDGNQSIEYKPVVQQKVQTTSVRTPVASSIVEDVDEAKIIIAEPQPVSVPKPKNKRVPKASEDNTDSTYIEKNQIRVENPSTPPSNKTQSHSYGDHKKITEVFLTNKKTSNKSKNKDKKNND